MIALSAGGALLAGALGGMAQQASAETLVENSAEFRFQLDFHVNDDARCRNCFPPAGSQPSRRRAPPRMPTCGSSSSTASTSPTLTTRPKTTDQLVYVAIPVKQTGTSNIAGQMIIAGLACDAKESPGPFGNYEPRTPRLRARSRPTRASPKARRTGSSRRQRRAHGDPCQIRARLGASQSDPRGEVLRSAQPERLSDLQGRFRARHHEERLGAGEGRVKEFTYKVTGGNLGALFDGTEKVLSWDSFHWYNRAILNRRPRRGNAPSAR